MNSNKQRKADERKKKKELGLVRYEFWSTQDQREIMRVFLSSLKAGYIGPLEINGIKIDIKNRLSL